MERKSSRLWRKTNVCFNPWLIKCWKQNSTVHHIMVKKYMICVQSTKLIISFWKILVVFFHFQTLHFKSVKIILIASKHSRHMMQWLGNSPQLVKILARLCKYLSGSLRMENAVKKTEKDGQGFTSSKILKSLRIGWVTPFWGS